MRMPQLFRVFDTAPAHPRAPLLWRDEMPASIVDSHDAKPDALPVDLIGQRGAVFGGQGLFELDGKLWNEQGISPDYIDFLFRHLGKDYGAMAVWSAGLFNKQRTVTDCPHPVLVPIHANWIYGHFLLEMLPRALLLDQVCPADWPILMADSAPGWLKGVLSKAVPKRLIQTYRPEMEVVKAPLFVGCDDLISMTYARPELRTMIEVLKTQLQVKQSLEIDATNVPKRHESARALQKIFISRQSIKNAKRIVTNQPEIEDAMSGLGYTIIKPEAMSFEDQVRVFDRADVIVGEYSSAMHNTLFSRPGTHVICLNWLNGYQSQIASLFQHTIGYIPPEDGQFRDARAVWSNEGKMRFAVPDIIAKLTQLEAHLMDTQLADDGALPACPPPA